MSESIRSPGPPPADARLPRPVGLARAAAPGVVFWLALVPLTLAPRHSGNVWSRYMTVESLVERGTLAIERSPLRGPSGSPDVVKVGRHLYSDKPPVLSALAAVAYAPLAAAGVRFAGPPPGFVWVNLVLVSATAGLASGLALAGVRLLLQGVDLPRWVSDLLALAVGFGSMLWSYGVTFNNHSVAAGLVTAAFAVVALEPDTPRRPAARRALAGLLAGLAATVDIPAGGATWLVLAVWLGRRARRVPLAYLAGSAAPVLLHAALQAASTGSPLPVEMTPGAFNYEGSYWATAAGRFREAGPRWQWGLELLFGPQGWLTVTPAVALGLAGMAALAARPRDPLGPLARATGVVVLILIAYYTWGVRRTDFAGLSYGTRHMLAVTPLVLVFAAALLGRVRRAWMAGVLVVFLGVGAVYAFEGMRDPWSRIERRDDPALRALKWVTLYPWSSYRR